MENDNEEIIDLTSLDYCIPYNNPRKIIICEEVIDLVNEECDDEITTQNTDNNTTNKKKSKISGGNKKTRETAKEENLVKIGKCSICWEKLGNNPLASTKCGHVYCLACLKDFLKFNKACPICRRTLNGPSAYHPLYLELG